MKNRLKNSWIGKSISYIICCIHQYITPKRELNFGIQRRKKLKRFSKKEENNIIDDDIITQIKNNGNNDNNHNEKVFDIAIIGGGFAGLSAALLLGRYIRPTIIFDVGNTRNSMTTRVHGYLGYENTCPKQLINKAWKDVMQYSSIKVVKEKVEKVDKHKDCFLLMTSGRTRSVSCKCLIIATGVEDIKPNIKNFIKFDGNGAWHCPHCDGFQSTGKKLIIISSGDKSINYAKEFLGWTKDIKLFINDGYQITPEELDKAKKLNIKVVQNDIPTKILVNKKGSLAGILCKSGRSYPGNIIFYYLGYKVRNQIARELGCKIDDEGFVKVNNMQQTTVPNVYAVGDIATDRHYVVLAAASGALAAISIYETLLKYAIRRKCERI